MDNNLNKGHNKQIIIDMDVVTAIMVWQKFAIS